MQQTIDLTIENFFRLSLDLFAICGLDGYFKQVNASFIRCIGCEEADLLEKPFIDLVHPDDRAATLGELKRLTDGLQVLQFENRYRCADGTFKWLSWMCYPSLEERLAYCVARDITEQRAARQQMKELAAELSRSNSDLAQFAYVASHDLQEPLRAVAGCVQLLAQRNQGTLDAKSQELIEHAVSGSKRMQTLINDLLEYSRVGSKGISLARVNPRDAVDQALSQLQVAVAESNALVECASLPLIEADARQLVQLFQNLIANALKFRGPNRPDVHIAALEDEKEAIFSIRDNGIGIEPGYHDRLFRVFQRLHTRREYPGSGIGLAICKRIVERHRGRIWVESTAGAGATFFFSIPR